MLDKATDFCRKVLAKSQSNFAMAFVFLSAEQRHALEAVYAFCRLVDDAVDDAPDAATARERLTGWRREVAAVYGDGHVGHPVAEELARARGRFPLRREDLDAVIEGCAWDLARERYATWDETEAYCHRVASAVGQLCIDVFGWRDPGARRYARDLGVALQLTNILRDVAEDARRGRVYLPLADLERFGVDVSDILHGRRTVAVEKLLRFEAQRARGYYLRARAAIGEDERRRLVVAEIMGDIYYALLVELEERGFPWLERTSLPTARKAVIALGRWARARVEAMAGQKA